jgi:hypothetical protein
LIRYRKKVKNTLKAKGFSERKSTHFFYSFKTGGLTTSILTQVSKGSSYHKLDEWHLKQMAKQCHLTIEQFLDLVDCSMSRSEYEHHLRNSDLIR